MRFVLGHSAFFRVIRKVGVTRFAARRRKPHAGGVCSPFPTTWVRLKWVRFPFGDREKSAKTSVFIGECSFSKMGSFGNFIISWAMNHGWMNADGEKVETGPPLLDFGATGWKPVLRFCRCRAIFPTRALMARLNHKTLTRKNLR